jgi:hypothetical protein
VVRIGIGSCNFTSAGLSGSKGNVESMIVYNGKKSLITELDNNIRKIKLTEENTDPDMKEDLPRHLPFSISVAFDWQTKKFEIKYRQTVNSGLSNVALWLTSDDKGPGIPLSNKYRRAPSYGGDLKKVGMFRVRYEYRKEILDHYGITLEYNLDYSEKEFTVNLSAKDILQSWGSAKDAWVSKIVDDESTFHDMKLHSSQSDIPLERSSTEEDVFNYYEDYRNIYNLRQKLSDAKERKDRRLIRQYLEIRADSIKAFVQNIPAIDNLMRRYLLTLEIDKLINDYNKYILDNRIAKNTRNMLKQYRQEVLELLIKELDNERGIPSDRARELLRWFEINIINVYS